MNTLDGLKINGQLDGKSGLNDGGNTGGVSEDILRCSGGDAADTLGNGGNAGHIDISGGNGSTSGDGGNGGVIEAKAVFRGAGGRFQANGDGDGNSGYNDGGYFEANAVAGAGNGGHFQANASATMAGEAHGGSVEVNAGSAGSGGFFHANGGSTAPGGVVDLSDGGNKLTIPLVISEKGITPCEWQPAQSGSVTPSHYLVLYDSDGTAWKVPVEAV